MKINIDVTELFEDNLFQLIEIVYQSNGDENEEEADKIVAKIFKEYFNNNFYECEEFLNDYIEDAYDNWTVADTLFSNSYLYNFFLNFGVKNNANAKFFKQLKQAKRISDNNLN